MPGTPDVKLVVKRKFGNQNFFPIIGDISLWRDKSKNGELSGQFRNFRTGEIFLIYQKTEGGAEAANASTSESTEISRMMDGLEGS